MFLIFNLLISTVLFSFVLSQTVDANSNTILNEPNEAMNILQIDKKHENLSVNKTFTSHVSTIQLVETL